MMAQKIPSIRCPGFTEPWEQHKLGELCSFDKGRGYSKADIRETGTPLVLYGRLYTQYETVIGSVDTFADPKDGSLYSRGGEVVVPGSGETAEDIAVASHIASSGMLLGGDLNVITPSSGIDPTFLAIEITNGSPHFQLAKKAQGKSVVHIHNEDIADVEFSYPSLPEQHQIGKLFSRLDSLITLHQREHDRLIDVRTSLMQKMFPGPGEDTPQIRFSEFSGAWRARKLGDLVTRYDHRVPTPDDGYTRLGVRSFARGTFLERVPADQAIGETELREVGANNLIVNIVFAWEQAIAITSEPDTVALVSHRFPQFSFNEGQCPAFYRYALLDPRFKHHLWLASPSGAGRNKTLRIDEMLDYEILVPDESEQRAIARFFKNLDQSIEARRRECDALVHAKSALLQKMFV